MGLHGMISGLEDSQGSPPPENPNGAAASSSGATSAGGAGASTTGASKEGTASGTEQQQQQHLQHQQQQQNQQQPHQQYQRQQQPQHEGNICVTGSGSVVQRVEVLRNPTRGRARSRADEFGPSEFRSRLSSTSSGSAEVSQSLAPGESWLESIDNNRGIIPRGRGTIFMHGQSDAYSFRLRSDISRGRAMNLLRGLGDNRPRGEVHRGQYEGSCGRDDRYHGYEDGTHGRGETSITFIQGRGENVHGRDEIGQIQIDAPRGRDELFYGRGNSSTDHLSPREIGDRRFEHGNGESSPESRIGAIMSDFGLLYINTPVLHPGEMSTLEQQQAFQMQQNAIYRQNLQSLHDHQLLYYQQTQQSQQQQHQQQLQQQQQQQYLQSQSQSQAQLQQQQFLHQYQQDQQVQHEIEQRLQQQQLQQLLQLQQQQGPNQDDPSLI